MLKNIFKPQIKLVASLLLAVSSILLFIYLIFLNFYQGKIYPGIKINNTSVSGQTTRFTSSSLLASFQNKISTPLKLNFQDQVFNIDLSSSDPQLNIDEVVNTAYHIGRSGNTIRDFADQVQTIMFGKNLITKATYQKSHALINQLTQINEVIKVDKADAKVNLDAEFKVIPSHEGMELDSSTLLAQIDQFLSFSSQPPVSIPVKTVPPDLTTNDAYYYQNILNQVKSSPIQLKFEDQTWTIDAKTLYSLLNFKNNRTRFTAASTSQTAVGQNILSPNPVILDSDKLAAYLKQIAEKIDREAQDAKFSIDPQNGAPPAQIKVKEFLPSQDGRKLDIAQTSRLITQALVSGNPASLTLPVQITPSKITTANINDFGIKELLGEGLSYFAGSIANRIYNIGLASSRLNGTLIPPGEIFSFNNTVGDISASTGYKPAYVIKSGRTVLDDGGGVCQVSTTLFRAVLNSGLPIVSRTAHAYRVGYYEQSFPPGLDATVFAPTVDFKFKNDTPNYILIQAYVYGLSLHINIYGTSDGRVSTLSTPVVSSQTPPPAELRQDDPTLPKGEVKQVDWSAWGANVSFNRTVKRGSETLISETFKSYYKPWQAIFLVGTKEN